MNSVFWSVSNHRYSVCVAIGYHLYEGEGLVEEKPYDSSSPGSSSNARL
jgi:hypothetical protein